MNKYVRIYLIRILDLARVNAKYSDYVSFHNLMHNYIMVKNFKPIEGLFKSIDKEVYMEMDYLFGYDKSQTDEAIINLFLTKI